MHLSKYLGGAKSMVKKQSNKYEETDYINYDEIDDINYDDDNLSEYGVLDEVDVIGDLEGY